MGRDRDDQREKDVNIRRWMLLTCICSTIIWFGMYAFLRSGFEGAYIETAKKIVNILFIVPIGSGFYSMFMDLKIRAKDRKKLE